MDDKFENGQHDLQKELQDWITDESLLIASVVKNEWPNGIGNSISTITYLPQSTTATRWRKLRKKDICNRTVHTYHLQHVALESSKIRINAVTEDLPAAVNGLKHSLRQLWEEYFVSSFVRLVGKSVCRSSEVENIDIPSGGMLLTTDPLYRINFFGKRVFPTKLKTSASGTKSIIDRKFTRAAEQLLVFHPDVVHLKFPDLDKWAGDIHWLNVRNLDPDSSEFNPDRDTGYYRVVCTVAAVPRKTHLGMVVTVLPPGFRGWLWWICWKAIGKA